MPEGGHESENRARTAARALQDVFASAPLRRLQLAWAGSVLGGWAYLVALGVYAYDEGGAAAVGLVGLIRMIPAAIAAPFTASLADRFSRVTVMVASDAIRFALMAGAAAVIAAGGPAPVVYVLVAASTVTGTVFRPAQAALLPALVRTPNELTAANVASSTIESIGTFLGPALGGLLLAVSSPEVVFAANGLTFLWSAALVFGLRGLEQPREPREAAADDQDTGLLAGIGTIVREPTLRTLVGLYAAQTLVAGALNVLVVVTSFELLDLDDAGVGLLYAAVGVGGLVGGFVALAPRARRAAGPRLRAGARALRAPARADRRRPDRRDRGDRPRDHRHRELDRRRERPDDHAARRPRRRPGPGPRRPRGAPARDARARRRARTGARRRRGAGGRADRDRRVLPVLALLSRPRLRALDERTAAPTATGLLRGVPMLAGLPEPVLERLAREAVSVAFPAGSVVLREGDVGDRFYVVERGEVAILGRHFGPGEGFGEIALLRDVPRTATATAVTDVSLASLEREPFVAAVTGHAPSAATADAVVAARLGSLSAGNDPL